MIRNLLRLNCNNNLLRQVTTIPRNVNGTVQNTKRNLTTDESKSFAHLTATAESEPSESITPTVKKHVNPFQQQISNHVSIDDDANQNSTVLKGDEREKRLKVLQLEVDIANQDGRRVPSLDFFKDHHWDYVLSLPTKSARYKYYGYLWQIQVRKESDKRKKEQRTEQIEQRKEELRRDREENNHIIYGLSHTTFFLRIYDTTINHWQNNKLVQAMQFAPKLVLDCSYDNHMNKREALNAAKQLMLCFAENRSNDQPFDLHYCNVDLNTICMQSLKRYIPTMLNPEFPMNVHNDCFTNIFPKKNIVYLTPHCRQELTTYNPDDVYVVGAMVDTVNNDPLSLAKAKRLGLRMARLPLDRYLQWGAGSGKSLTLNQMINIMLDLKNTGNWEQALKHVPRRKVIETELQELRQRKFVKERARRLNVRIGEIINDESECKDQRRHITAHATPEKIRTQKEGMLFNMNTWGSGKKLKKERKD